MNPTSLEPTPPSFRLPDTLVDLPWARRLNPHYEEVKSQSSDWIRSFNAFEEKQQRRFDLCNFGLLAGLSYSLCSPEVLRVGCDFLNFAFVYDEYTDVLDKVKAQNNFDVVMDALRNPAKPRPKGESLLGEIARQFWVRAMKTVAPHSDCLERFISEFEAYARATVEEAGDHDVGRLRSVKDYMALRRDTSGCGVTLSIIDFDLDLPQEVLQHPDIVKLTEGAMKLIALVNDLNSYVMEQSRGLLCHNIVSAIMNDYQLDYAGTMDWLEVCIREEVSDFISNLKDLPTWDEDIDTRVNTYIDSLGYWIRGNDCWSFEGHRYFGEEGLKIQRDRWVTLQPPGEGYCGIKFSR